MQAERGLGGIEGHGGADFSVGQVGRIAADRQTELPEVDADLVRAAGSRPGFEQRGAIGKALDDLKVRERVESVSRSAGSTPTRWSKTKHSPR